jgi:ABC-2 type transport system permease protein
MLPALLMAVVFTALFDRIVDVRGFPGSDGYEAFLTPGVVVLVSLLGAGATSASLAADLRSGYFDRLRLIPGQPVTQLIGRLVFETVRLVPGVVVVLTVGLLLGGENRNGLFGLLVVVLLVAALGAVYSCVFFVVAIRTADPQTPFQLQPLGLPLAFLSSALVPLSIMPGWAETIARYNPVTVVVDASRGAMLGDLWSTDLAAATAVLSATLAVAGGLSLGTLHRFQARS